MVRDYLAALIGGNPVAANRALGRAPDNADFPEREFVNRSSQITDMHTKANADGSYTIEAEVSGSNGTYYCTFVTGHSDVTPYFTDHYCIKVN